MKHVPLSGSVAGKAKRKLGNSRKAGADSRTNRLRCVATRVLARYRGRKVRPVINEAVNPRPGCKKMKFPSRARARLCFIGRVRFIRCKLISIAERVCVCARARQVNTGNRNCSEIIWDR